MNDPADGPGGGDLTPAQQFLTPNIRGALWMLLGVLFFSAMSVIIKILGPSLGSPMIAFFRTLFGLVVVLPFALRLGLSGLKTQRMSLHLGRGIFGASGMMCAFYAITMLPLADAIALSFTRPLFLIVLAVLFLGEVVRARRWTATAVGFIGVVVMMRPSTDMEAASFIALSGALLVAVAIVFVKKLSVTERPSVLLFYFGIISSLVTLGPALLFWRDPSTPQLVALLAVGALAASGQTCVIRGLAVGEATAVSPFDYARILLAAVIGYVLFGEVPDVWTWVGAGIVVTASIYIAQREARAGSGGGTAASSPQGD